jgi:hypothetical protein
MSDIVILGVVANCPPPKDHTDKALAMLRLRAAAMRLADATRITHAAALIPALKAALAEWEASR